MYIIYKIDFAPNIVCNSTINCSLGPVHTYRDIFESATFSGFQDSKISFPCPHVAYSNRNRMSTHIPNGIQIHCSTHFSSAKNVFRACAMKRAIVAAKLPCCCCSGAILVYCSVIHWTRISFVIGFENSRIHLRIYIFHSRERI